MPIAKVALTICLITGLMFSRNALGNTWVSGHGAHTCTMFLENRPFGDASIGQQYAQLAYASWISGYISGWNMSETNRGENVLISIPDFKVVLAHIEKFCRDNPSEFVLAGVIKMMFQLPKVSRKP
jgi:hypothetical protein